MILESMTRGFWPNITAPCTTAIVASSGTKILYLEDIIKISRSQASVLHASAEQIAFTLYLSAFASVGIYNIAANCVVETLIKKAEY